MKWLIDFGGRRFFLCVFCGGVTSVLCWFGKIDGATYSLVIISTVGAYITGNTYQKSKEIEANNESI